MRVQVAEIVSQTLQGLDLQYPPQDADRVAHLKQMQERLENEP